MRRRTFRIQPSVDADGICQSQTPLAGGALTLNGALISGGKWTASVGGQLLAIASAGNDSGRTFTVTGKDVDGKAVSISITGPNATTVKSTTYFSEITGVSVDAATAGAITVGFAGEAASPTFVVNYKMQEFKTSLFCVVSGTINYTVQYTPDDVFDGSWTAVGGTWFDHDDTDLVGATASKSGNYAYPPVATRVKVNSVTSPGYVDFTVICPA
jgi:VCBS repeat-containing protein